MRFRLRLSPVQIALISAILCVLFLFCFSLYKLITLSGLSVILVIVIASTLVVIVAFGLKEASDKMIPENSHEFTSLTKEELGKCSEKQYNLMNTFVVTSLLAASGLILLGAAVVWLVVMGKNKDFIDFMLGGFGLVILSMGIYFTITVINELRFLIKNRPQITAKIIEYLSNNQ